MQLFRGIYITCNECVFFGCRQVLLRSNVVFTSHDDMKTYHRMRLQVPFYLLKQALLTRTVPQQSAYKF
jgi:hypothetical protein